MNTNPIGIFDSGIGGLSVWKAIQQLMPQEHLHYRADQANCPYGPQSQQEVIHHCRSLVKFFLHQQVKLIVVACNTATAAAIDTLRQSYGLPFVGMEPAIKPATQLTQTGRIGILATEGTLKGALYKRTKERYAKESEVFVQVGYGLVEMVESAEEHSPTCMDLLRQYLEPMLEKGIDQLVLGCTHYPFLIPSIRKIAGNHLNIIDPAPAIALQTQRILTQTLNLNIGPLPPAYTFSTSGNTTLFHKQLTLRLPSIYPS